MVIALATGAALMSCAATMASIGQAGDAQTTAQPASSFVNPSAPSGAQFWKFDEIENYYYETKGHSLRLSVRYHGKDFLWDPENGVLEKIQTDNFNKLYMNILGIYPTALKDGAILRGYFSTDCGGRDFADPFLEQVIEGDRKVGGFYILAKRQPPEEVFRELPGGQDCYDTEHQERMYREIGRPLVARALPLPDDSVLFFDLYDGYVVKLKHAPRAALDFGGNVFFVPEADVEDDLAKAGPDLHRRYAVFLKAVAAARLVQPTALKEITR